MGSGENIEQKKGPRKGQISSLMERFHGGGRYMGELGKPEECWRLAERVLRKSIGGTTARLGNRRRRKMTENTVGEGSLDGTPPGDYMDGQMESMTNSTGRGWKEIGDSRRRRDWQTKGRGD